MAEVQERPLWHLDPQSGSRLSHGTDGNPFAVLGPHDTPSGRIIRAYLPGAATVEVLRRSDGVRIAMLEYGCEPGLFEGFLEHRSPYRFRIHWPGAIEEIEDPYSYGPLLGELDLHLFNEGRHFQLAHALGAQTVVIDGVPGVRFAVWAPNASRVAVVGDFNSWDRRRHPMRVRHGAGIWELFIPRVSVGSRYKYDILGTGGIPVPWKADPVARQTETPPSTASVVPEVDPHRWTDSDWMATRSGRQGTKRPSLFTKLISAHGWTEARATRASHFGISLSID